MRISFSVTYYGEENYALVIIGEDEKFLVVPEGEPVPEDLPEDITPLLQPLTNMYLAATSAMDFSAIWMQWIRSPFPVQTVPAGI